MALETGRLSAGLPLISLTPPKEAVRVLPCVFRRSLVVVLVLLVAALLPAMAQASWSHPHPKLSWQIAGSATAGSVVPFSWVVKHRSRGSRLVVQRQTGTARVWRTIAKPSGAQGSGHLPRFALGIYRLRIAVLSSRGVVLAQQVRTLHVFGSVPFSTLFRDTSGGVYTTPTRTFAYVIAVDDLTSDGTPATAITDSNNHCRSIHFDFIPGAEFDHTGESGTLTVVQETRDPLSASAPFNGLGSLDATLVPGRSWSVTLSHAGGVSPLTFYMNGSASCDSTGPLPLPAERL